MYSFTDALNEQEKYYNSANDMDYDTLFQTHRLQRQWRECTLVNFIVHIYIVLTTFREII